MSNTRHASSEKVGYLAKLRAIRTISTSDLMKYPRVITKSFEGVSRVAVKASLPSRIFGRVMTSSGDPTLMRTLELRQFCGVAPL